MQLFSIFLFIQFIISLKLKIHKFNFIFAILFWNES